VNTPAKRWSEEETKLALYLYFQLPFGHLHSGNPEIQKLANILGRTHSSVAMKLSNFASFDPKITESGRKGLQGASRLDKRIWEQFSKDWTGQIEDVERVLSVLDENEKNKPTMLRENASLYTFEPYDRLSSAEAVVERRVGQGFFRRSVLTNFDNRCCITGIAEPILLNASHIIPWGMDIKNRHNPSNGLCLSAMFDRAFDRGLITLDSACAVIVSESLLTHNCPKTRAYFTPFDRVAIKSPSRFDPDPAFLSWHRNEVFLDA
jgi:putative restriction endonuclease